MKLFEINNSIKDHIDLVKKNCKPWLKKAGGFENLAFRGLKNPIDETFFKKSIRKNRNPRDSKKIVHSMWNKIIKNAGLTANRSNSAFVTGNIYDAGYYGDIYLFFPIGNFKYTWSPLFRDWNYDLHPAQVDLISFFKKIKNITNLSPEEIMEKYNINYNTMSKSIHDIDLQILYPFYEDILQNNLKGNDNSLKEALNSGKEIMIYADSAYYLSYHKFYDELQ